MSEPLDIEPIRERVKAATPGPWTNPWRSPEARSDGFYTDQPTDSPPNAIEPDAIVVVHPWDGGTLMVREHDSAFIAHARQDVPALLQEVERLRKGLRTIATEEVNGHWNCQDFRNEIRDQARSLLGFDASKESS